ncbi:N-acetylmuramoyl-L-alanine amidase family protein [Clostridium sp. YIM B02569]|uniref:N-acetylmuramoyl-L-alanine amidase family protein n=1 Tax=Clostridium sp. YIM B02569 TaxID=2911967 RepID=UPI001EEC69B6|nr:N-acetylmuramoyl-L-alanine amidase family protein [Clostridium sp. YIM B02569]
MFRRANKITSLLLAAAAIVSIAPATGAYAADYKKIEAQDGTIYDAVAYKDGKFYIDGEVNDKDEAVYYLNNGKYNDVSDIDTGSSVAAYGDKYVDVSNGDYFLDLGTGKATDESIKSNAEDDAAAALRKKIKKDTDGRYVEGSSANQSEAIPTVTELPGAKFGEVWYETQYSAQDATNKNTSYLNVYTDANGAYIDADYKLGKIKVTTTESGVSKAVSVDNTNDKYDANTTKGDVTGSVDSTTAKVIGQDADYIYRTATVTISTTNSIVQKINGIAVSGNSAFKQTTGAVTFDVIQKISKAQASDNIKGAKYAKTVTAYVISDDKGADKTGDLINAANGYTDSGYTVVDGKIVNYGITSDKQIATQTITLKGTNGYTYTDFADLSKGEDIEKSSDSGNSYDGYAFDIDASGNLWRLNGGYIYEWNNDKDWDKVYKVDGSFDEMSVYNKDNIVAWNQSDAVYSVIGGTKADDTTTDTAATTPAVTAGWVQATNGTWTYNKADGTKAAGWLNLGGNWYYLKADGVMGTGWVNDNGTWYFLSASGAMATGWLNDNGTWYYLNSSGAMLANTTVDGYVLGANGAWIR